MPLFSSKDELVAKKSMTVTELTELIKTNLESSFAEVSIVGEVSNFKSHPSGHFYFSLKDEGAMIAAVMFRGSNAALRFKLHDGLKIVASGRISVFPPRGNYQIIITRCEPEGLGALQLAYEQLKKKLEALGYFNPERKRAIPKLPKCVGIVTSPSGAAIRDILNILARRFSGVSVLVYPVKVQGDGAAGEIAKAIGELNSCFSNIEVLIVGRGGGSIEDLWAFNEEIVAKAIFESRIPVISAVGHEVDFTIADFVADLRAPTPSAAAELVIANKADIFEKLDSLVSRLLRFTSRLEHLEMQVDELTQRLNWGLEKKIHSCWRSFEICRARLNESSPRARVQEYRHKLIFAIQRIRKESSVLIRNKQWQVDSLSQKLNLLNPRTIMARGYSIVRVLETKKVVKKAADVRMGDKLLIELHKGQIVAKV